MVEGSGEIEGCELGVVEGSREMEGVALGLLVDVVGFAEIDGLWDTLGFRLIVGTKLTLGGFDVVGGWLG